MQNRPTAQPKTNHPPAQGGYTIVELAIALTIIGVLIVAGLAGVSSLLTSSKTNDEIKAQVRFASKISAIYQYGSIPTINTATLIGLGAFDSNRVSGTDKVNTSFGTALTVIGANSDPIGDLAAGGGVLVKLGAIPKAACADLANGIGNVIYSLVVTDSGSLPFPSLTAFSDSTIAVKTATSSLNPARLAVVCNTTAASYDFFVVYKP